MEQTPPAAEVVATEAYAEGGIVQLLSDEVINQIAAGEVVERPASVVKELVDNAIDAGATSITVECDAGGKARIRVVDDGVGMAAIDAQRCFARHATSKLRAIDDLLELPTMGFRGEALSSIASVSRTVLTTRRGSDLAATRVTVDHGRITEVAVAGAAVGTTVEVADLFANVPARLKFLKGEATEASHVTETVSRFAMAHPAVHVRLRHNGRTVLELPPDRDGLSRASAVVGVRLGQRLHRVVGQEHGIQVEAFLASPELAQTTARGVQLFVGRRAVRDRGLLHAVAMGYGELVPRGRYPVAIVLVEVPAGAVDFNVHPQKSEVRFVDASAVAAAVRHVVRAGVSAAPWLQDSAAAATAHMTVRTSAPTQWAGDPAGPPIAAGSGPRFASSLAHRYAASLASDHAQLRFDRPGGVRPGATPARAAEGGAPRWEAAVRAVHAPRLAEGLDAEVDAETPGTREAPETRETRETPEVLPARQPAVVQGEPEPRGAVPAGISPQLEAAVAAAVAAQASPRGAQEPGVASAPQGPSEPQPVAGFFSSLRFLGQLQLTYLVCEAAGEMVLIDQHAAHERVEFQRLMERRQQRQAVVTQRLLFPSTIEVSAAHVALAEEVAPLWAQIGYEIEPFGKASIAIKAVPAAMRGADPSLVLRELLDEWLDAGASRAVESRLENVLATIACHCAVRAGDRLTSAEVEALLRAMDQVDFRAHCPHGRPVLLRLSIDEIARRFGR